MKNIICLAWLLISALTSKPQTHGINFERADSWNEVLRMAKREKKNIFVDCFATWCGPCKMMDKDVYENNDVGKIINSKYISVKLQLDRSALDNIYTRSWYSDAQLIMNTYQVSVYPTMLFIAPDGRILSKLSGYLNAVEFIKHSLDVYDSKTNFEYLDSLYKDNKLALTDFRNFADKAFELGKPKLGWEVRARYKSDFLDRLPLNKLLSYEYLNYFRLVPELLTSKDKLFRVCLNRPYRVDSIIRGLSQNLVKAVITKEQIYHKLFINSHPSGEKPNWQLISSSFKKYYPYADCDEYFLKEKISLLFQQRIIDWEEFANSVDSLNKKYPVDRNDIIGLKLQNNYAWYGLFLNSNDKHLLERALKWQEEVIAKSKLNEFLDTKANLLYKLGRTIEAIEIEKSIVDSRIHEIGAAATNPEDEFYSTLLKMKNNKPTWK
ncbi:thioredoxin family protein [Pedobacter aquatilis]|uniref:thioredoxin family protein n=1 Tax=Pedobacter aquatilis TaxID=351343 RepID=UPI002930E9EA|nr:DUF255 domain-containing protein [Pedobacter aquatilis]